MCENSKAVKQEIESPTSAAFGKILDKISDRMFPDENDPKNKISKRSKTLATFAGSYIWCIYGSQWIIAKTNVSTVKRGSSTGVLEDLNLFDRLDYFSIFLIMLLGSLFIPLICGSFDRGRPLTFFFWGLIFPTMALRILDLAFYPISVQ